MSLFPGVAEDLRRHGIEPGPDDSPAQLRERLNDVYLERVRALRDRQKVGEIPLPSYASHVEQLKQQFLLLGLPIDRWTD